MRVKNYVSSYYQTI